MKFTYIKLSRNQGKANDEINQVKNYNENYKISNNENNLRKKGNFKGRRYLDKREKSDKQKILNVNSEERFLNKSYKNVEENCKNEEAKKNIKKLLSKNQVALYAISLMLITSGYFNYTNKLKTASLGDAQLVNSNIVDESEVTNETSMEMRSNETSTEIIQNNETAVETSNILKSELSEQSSNIVDNNLTEQTTHILDNNDLTNKTDNNLTEQTSNKVDSKEYFTQTKLERDKMYSQMIETYEKILENSNISTEQKNTASEEIKNINNKRNGIATSETLIKAKGIEEVVIIVNSDVIDAIVKSNNNLSQEQVAQVSNIISRELDSNIENIHITTHK